jgi:hypothetical protein
MDHAKLSSLGSETGSSATEKATRFFVLSGGGGEWLIYREGVMNPIESQPGKLLAIENAKALAKLESPGEVLVEQRNGTFKVQYASPASTRVLQA